MAKGLFEKREEARRLRKEEGLSINEIVSKVGASKGSVSVWIRDVPLTEEQKICLHEKNPAFGGKAREKSGELFRKTWTERRRVFQEAGRKMMKDRDPDFIAGCMLYWAEGSKSKNSVHFTNMDSSMLRVFILFLRRFFDVKNEDIRISLNFYSNSGLSILDVENHWLKELDVPRECLLRTRVDADKRVASGKKIISSFGICRVAVDKTEVVQKIFGAIQEYGNFTNRDWIG